MRGCRRGAGVESVPVRIAADIRRHPDPLARKSTLTLVPLFPTKSHSSARLRPPQRTRTHRSGKATPQVSATFAAGSRSAA